jgi:16S rRNA (uracil1498-N3)-methyltransferase
MVEPMFWSEFSKEPLVGDRFELGGSEGKHAASVRRMRVGEAIQLTDGAGLRVRGLVSDALPKSLVITIESVERESPAKNQITLIQALAKGDRDELAIQAATELGACSVIPWQAERSISRWDAAKSAKGQARWQIICDEAAKQSLSTHFPKVEHPLDTAALAQVVKKFDQVLVLDPTAQLGLGALGVPEGSIALVVGPEGGISPEELVLLENAGARRVHLGDSILRTSTAGIAAIAAIQTLSGQYH